jgi:urease accessory protein
MSEFSGHLMLRAEVREHGKTVLAGQSFRAPFHVGKAYWDEEGAALRVQVVNPTAGILEGIGWRRRWRSEMARRCW